MPDYADDAEALIAIASIDFAAAVEAMGRLAELIDALVEESLVITFGSSDEYVGKGDELRELDAIIDEQYQRIMSRGKDD